MTLSLSTLTLIVLALLAVLCAGLWLGLRRLRAANEDTAGQLRSMQQDLRALCNAAVTVGERVNRLEQQARELYGRQEELGVRQDRIDQSSEGSASYEQAIKMARKGASVEDLVEVCGLARGEAELISMMHRYNG